MSKVKSLLKETAAARGNKRACALVARDAAECPPRLIGGEQNKTPNPQGADQTFEFEYFSHFVSDGKGRLIEIPLRRGRDDGAFIDQITITFGTAQDGKTNATVSTTERPDVEPNSPIAPPAPDDKPQTPGDNDSPDDNPDSKPDDDPNGKPKDNPGENTGTGSDTGKSEDSDTRKEEKPSEKEQGFLCSMFPNILACAEVGQVNESENPFKIPTVENKTAFASDIFLPSTGQCPAPLKTSYLGIDIEFKYDFICQFAEKIRFVIIGLAALAAAYIMFSGKKE